MNIQRFIPFVALICVLTHWSCSSPEQPTTFVSYSATDLPVISIETGQTEVNSRENYIPARISIQGNEDFPGLDAQEVRIRGRGNSSWWQGLTYGKLPYQIRFEDKRPILGMPSDRRWVLLSELSDKSLIRNKISRDLGFMSRLEYTPDLRYAMLEMNGEPQGIYLIGQKAEETNNRLAIGDAGFLIEIDQLGRIDTDDVYFTSDYFRRINAENVFNIKEPDLARGSEAYVQIRDHIAAFEEVLFSENFADPETGYAAYIDLDSFVDWYLIQEIGKSVDSWGFSSVFFHYTPGGKIKMGPLWDFDLSFGNVDYAAAEFTEGFWITINPWYDRLFEDPNFRIAVKSRYAYFYEQLPDLMDKIDMYAEYLDGEHQINYSIWETLGTYVWPNPIYFDTYTEEVAHLKTWLGARMDWMNNALPGRYYFGN